MSDQVEALRSLGAHLVSDEGHLPLRSDGGGVRGGGVQVNGATSSQFVSGLLLCGPLFDEGVDLEVMGSLVSRPYLDMTIAVMEAFGVPVEHDDQRRFGCPHGVYASQHHAIEPDASAASYFFGLAAMTRGRIRVEGLGQGSIQGDMAFLGVLEAMGAVVRQGDDWTEVVGRDLRGVDVDLADFSDTAPTLAAVAAVADSPTRVRGIGFVRGKESDRIGGVITELGRLGVDATEHDDGFTIYPGRVRPEVVRTYADHRMAMAFSLLGVVSDGVAIADPGCVAKTFPGFWGVLESVRAGAGSPGRHPGRHSAVQSDASSMSEAPEVARAVSPTTVLRCWSANHRAVRTFSAQKSAGPSSAAHSAAAKALLPSTQPPTTRPHMRR